MTGRYEVARHFTRWTVIDHANYDDARPVYDTRAAAESRCRALNPTPTLFDKDPDMTEPTTTPSVWDELPAYTDDEVPQGVLRDQWKRPLIVPPGGDKAVPYTRVSTFAGYLDNGGGLTKWKVRNAALGIARHDDLRRMVAALAYGDPELDELIETATTRMDDKAAWGTAVHSFTEPDPSPYVPEEMAADVQSYKDVSAAHGLVVEQTELFVVNDELRVAGTLDHVLSGKVTDKKTGKAKAQAVAIQLSCYANSVIYDPATGERTPLGASKEVGLLAHIPKEEGRTEFFEVDLVKGYRAAKVALFVSGYNKDKTLLTPLVVPERPAVADPLLAEIAACESQAALGALWRRHQHSWTDELTAASKARLAQIPAAA